MQARARFCGAIVCLMLPAIIGWANDRHMHQPVQGGQLSERAAIAVSRFRLHGNTVFTEQALRRAVLSRYEGRRISAEELQQMRRELSELYVRRGYLNSGAVLPDQQVRNGIVRINIIEGRLTRIVLPVDASATARHLSARLARQISSPLNGNQIAEQLILLQDDPAVLSVDGRLNPGGQAGQAQLDLTIKERPAWQFGFGIANDRSPGIGSERLSLTATRRSLSGRADPLRLQLGLTTGQVDGLVSYSHQIDWHDILVGALLERSHSSVVEAPFNTLDITSRTDRAAISASRPIVRSKDLNVSLQASIEGKWSRTALLGQPFSFSSGSQNGRARVAVMEFAYNWALRSRDGAAAIRTAARFGRNGLRTIVDPVLGPIVPRYPVSYTILRGQLQVARRVGERGNIQGRFDAQFTSDPLVQMERLSIGGIDSVRGYRENRIIRDRGVIASLQYSHELGRTTFGGLLSDGPVKVTGSVFADYGVGSNVVDPTPASRWLGSVGLGLALASPQGWRCEFVYGRRLNQSERLGASLQDYGWVVQFSYQTR